MPKPTVPNICPECGHQFRGNGFDGVDAHWRAKHEHIMPYSEAWPLDQIRHLLAAERALSMISAGWPGAEGRAKAHHPLRSRELPKMPGRGKRSKVAVDTSLRVPGFALYGLGLV